MPQHIPAATTRRPPLNSSLLSFILSDVSSALLSAEVFYQKEMRVDLFYRWNMYWKAGNGSISYNMFDI
jgi:hypothetical protein